MKAQNKSMALFGIAFGLLLALSVQAAPLVSNVVGVQRAGTKLVDITYDLTDAEYSSFIVTIKISKDAGATWDVPCESVSGDGIGSGVDPGKNKSIVWDAGADWNGQWSDRMKVKITATVDGIGGEGDDDPLGGEYLVVDLSMGPNAARYPMSRLDAVPANGWTDEYKTTKLVLRKIPAGTLVMGSPENERGRDADVETQHHVTLTKGFCVGVFEVTQKQWELVVGSWPSKFSNETCRDTRPVERVSHDKIRGKTHGMFWPGSYAVDADSFMGRLRAKTGLDFDLPTEAQWEYACRAGTLTALNSGMNLTTEEDCANLGEVGRYWFNGGQDQEAGVDTDGGTARAGSYQPNTWGLYDMHGNVLEWCLDWWDGGDYSPQPATDPKGGNGNPLPDNSPCRIIRGGSWAYFANCCRSAYRGYGPPTARVDTVGFRVVKTMR